METNIVIIGESPLFETSSVTQPTSFLIKAALREIRNYLAGQVIGLTRDESLLEEVIKCTFCRAEIERQGESDAAAGRSTEALAKHYRQVFTSIKGKFPHIFPEGEEILLSPAQISFVDQRLSALGITSGKHDVVGDIYETFIGTARRGQEGQFFTPTVAINALVSMTRPQIDDLIIDPACGSGGFLLHAAKYIQGEALSPRKHQIHGVEKDSYLVRLAEIHIALHFDTTFPIHCADSLIWGGNGFEAAETKRLKGEYTLVLANPPFGAKIVAVEGDERKNFALAYKWALDKKTQRYVQTNTLVNSAPPQVLFMERMLSLVADGGRLGIVLPESIVSSPKYRHVMQYITDLATPVAVIGMPESLFKTSGKGGTHTKVVLLVLKKGVSQNDTPIFMAEAKWCGNDSRGRDIPNNDLPAIVEKFSRFTDGKRIEEDHFGFTVKRSGLKNLVLAPRFYNPDILDLQKGLKATHDFYKFGDLVEAGHIRVSTGDEIGKLAYGTGSIPFVRTSDISNWEIKSDPKHLVNKETYSKYAKKQDVRAGDILMVRDGTYLIGTCAFVTKYDTEMVYQSHIYKIRVNSDAPFDGYLLLAALSSQPVVAQIQAMAFTQDIINSLGTRINDLVLPIPKSAERRSAISEMVKRSIDDRIEARELARRAREIISSDEPVDLYKTPASS